MALACMGEGLSYPTSFSAFKMGSLRPRSWNEGSTGGFGEVLMELGYALGDARALRAVGRYIWAWVGQGAEARMG